MYANASCSSWDEDCFQEAKLPPELLAVAELPHSHTPAAHYLVAELTGVEDSSPTFLVETISALSQCQSAAQPSDANVEQHRPGVNDLMTGAVDPSVQPSQTTDDLASIVRDDNDSTICRDDWSYLIEFMPYKLFSLEDIVPLNVFHAPDNINLLPSGFHTTTLGLKKVGVEIWKGQEDAVYTDEELLTELVKVGGVPQSARCGVVYPEDLVPCTSESEWDDDHRMYWEILGDLVRTSWREDEAEEDQNAVGASQQY